MPKLKTSRPKGSEAVIFVYASPAQKAALEAAAVTWSTKKGIPGRPIATYRWVLLEALEAARKLGVEVEEE